MTLFISILFALFLALHAIPQIRFVSNNYPDRYVRHRNFELYVEVADPAETTDLYVADSTWKLQPGLADDDYFSLESINYADYYVRHQDYRVKLATEETSDLYKNDASWKFVSALNNQFGYISIQSKNYPTHYMRHRNYELWIDEAATDDLYKNDASYKVECSTDCPEPQIRMTSSNYPDHYVRHRNYELFIDPEEATDLYVQDSTFTLKTGLAGGEYVSFESVNYPNQFVRHSGYRLKISTQESSDLYKEDASFKPVSPLNGKDGYVSFQSKNYPTRYMRHRNYELWIDEAATDALYLEDASFRVECVDNTNCPQYLYTFLNLGIETSAGDAVENKEDKGDKDMNGDIMEVYGIATFIAGKTEAGVAGEVSVDENGNVIIELDLSSLDNSLCDFSAYDEASYLYVIHNEWNCDDTEKYGPDCNADTIGDRMDPFETGKVCSDISEEIDYFNCELGDLSGRLGVITPDSDNKVFIEGNISYSSSSGKNDGFCSLRLSPEIVYKKSVTFSCNDDAKTVLFCGAFQLYVYDEGRD